MGKYLLTLSIGAIFLLSNCDNSGDTMVDEFSATVSVSASTATVSESDGTASFSVSISTQNISGSTISIPFTLSGSATESEDYQVAGSTVTIAADETSGSIEITIVDDSEVESSETIEFSLGTLPEGVTGSTTSATITINDNDTDSGGGISAPITVEETTNNSVALDEWTDTSADNYIVVVNSENSFTPLSDQSSLLPSSTYLGVGEQVVYNSTSVASFEISLLSPNSTYYVKLVTVTDGSYDNELTSISITTAETCETSSTTESQVCFDIGTDTRTISSNQYPNHPTGNFPNYEGPNGEEFLPIEVTRVLTLNPEFTNQAIYIYNESGPPTPSNDNFYQFGMAINGVEFHPMGLKPWAVLDAGGVETGEENWAWQAKVTEEGETDLDQYGAHVTSAGNYHYHGDITGLANEDGSRHSLIYGFAADGFPIYYKYGFTDPDDPDSDIVELTSSYQLKNGARVTDSGFAGQDYPGGNYDGTYIQDFEYVQGLGDLDECNGRTGVTPEYPDGTYYYVITSAFPVVPNCFYGTPAEDWKIGN